ncbi:peptidase S41 family protein [Cordyceps fumosorosea ARSEF 2679]|uniref:Peptidase S41 family protein n=1 Tax=Cordyceps fumosorosea (strain ARSEF 2679) TaxID=1081104 RepID=A0A167WHF6_CORFA|nr:peptidase S41 family protein [Cordyceps fumosorosea ARSEF 2679]OAA63794.1 peptidase S41 family protein [Cordyceps fumosorosea ARSEF 2679]
MLPTLAVLLMAARPALAVVHYRAPHRNLLKTAVRAPPYFSSLGVQANAETDPCAMISQAFEAANKNKTSEDAIILDLRPSVGTACLKSVPVATEQNLALLDYLSPYIDYQSTLEILKNPPEEYLLPGVDIMGGIDAMRKKLQGNGYESQFEVMTDLRSLFVAANDNHFGYTPGLFNAFRQVREDFEFVSISSDGRELPEIFAVQDVFPEGNATFTPSPIETIDGVDVYEFLENDVLRVEQGHQDPDARLNAAFGSIPGFAAGVDPSARLAIFEIPDNYTIVHKNGTSRTVVNSLITLPTIDLCGIRSGDEFRERFEVPPLTPPPPPPGQEDEDRKNKKKPPPPEPEQTVPGYPPPVAKHSANTVASYMLDDPALANTTVISFLAFVALNSDDPLGEDFDLNGFVREFGDVMDQTAAAAREQGRQNLIIDMSANGGGSLDLADFAYTTFFPGAPFDAFDRYRMSGGVELTGRFLDFPDASELLVGPGAPGFGPDGGDIETAEAFFEAPQINGQNVTAAFHRSTAVPYLTEPDVFLRGYEPKGRGGGGNDNNNNNNNNNKNNKNQRQRRSRSRSSVGGRRNHINQLRNRKNNKNNSKSNNNNDNSNNNNNGGGGGDGGQQAPPWKPENMVILTDGTCASACTIFTGLMVRNFGIRTVALGGRPLNKPMQAIGGVRGSEILNNGDIKGLMSEFAADIQQMRDGGRELLSTVTRALPPLQDAPILPLLEDSGGGSANVRNAHPGADPDGLPLHFTYEAANCRLFYTREMLADVTEAWKAVAEAAWGGGRCVEGSTVNEDGTMGNGTLPFDSSVRGRAARIPVPGGETARIPAGIDNHVVVTGGSH